MSQAGYSEQSNSNGDVCTPERELAIVRAFAPIGLDPCSSPTSTVSARYSFSGPPFGADGLIEEWSPYLAAGEISYANPPYGTEALLKWGEKMNREAALGCEIIALLPGRFETRWFKALRPDRICWYGRRVQFIDAKAPGRASSAKFPSVFLYYGRRPERFEAVFSDHGTVTSWRR